MSDDARSRRTRGYDDLSAVMRSASGGLFEGNLFIGRRGMGLGDNGDAPARRDIPLTDDAVDGDLAFVLWHMGVLDASLVGPGISQVIAGMRALARRMELQPATAVSQAGETATVDARIYTAIQQGAEAVESLSAEARTAALARLDSERTRQGAPVMPAAEKEALLARQSGDGLLPSNGSSGAPQWLPWALVGGGILVAGGIIWAATRRRAPVAANRRKRRRRRRRTTR